MEDYILRATAGQGTIRAFATVTTNMVKAAQETHQLSPIASAALGRTLTASAMMAKMLKGEKDTLTIQIKGDGPLGGIVVVTDPDANVRGYVHNPAIDLPFNKEGKLDVGGAVGKNGYLNVIKDLGLKEPYVGYVNIVSGEIAEDIAFYFANSEQVPAVVALGVLVSKDGIGSSGGFMVQLMPDADDKTIDILEKKVASLPSISALLNQGETPESMLQMILGELEVKIIEKSPCHYACNCSRERMERNLASLGREELQSIIDEQDEAELQCHFCNEKYHFSKQDLVHLLDEISKGL